MLVLRLLFAVLLLGIGACDFSSGNARKNDTQKAELEAMLDTDQALRVEIQLLEEKLGADSPKVKELWATQRRADQKNVERLVRYVESRGWPGSSQVGEKAATAAFLVLQHADLPLQQQLLPLLRKSTAIGEFKAHRLAMLEDRIAVRTGKPQSYGTQVYRDESTGLFRFSPISDEANVDKRREAVGLEPLAEYAKGFGFDYSPPISN